MMVVSPSSFVFLLWFVVVDCDFELVPSIFQTNVPINESPFNLEHWDNEMKMESCTCGRTRDCVILGWIHCIMCICYNT